MMWKLVMLGDVCNLKNGFAFKSKLFKDKGFPILRISNIQNGRIDTRRPVYFNPTDYKVDLKKYEVKTGDLLIAMSGATTGKIGFNESQTTFYLNQRVGKLVPGKDLDKKYLYYLLSTKIEENLKISKGAAQPNLSSEQIKNIIISLPSILEQQSIVAKLDIVFSEIDEGISQTQKSIENTNLLFEEKIKQYFIHNITNSPIVKLSDISEYFNGLTYSPKDVSEDGLIVLRSGNIQNGKMKYQDIKRVNKKIKDKLYVKPTDILICSRNGSQRLIGKSSLIGEIKEPMTFGTFMMILRSEHNKYLQWFIKSKLFKKQILKGENTMINQITRYMLDDISLPFPDKKKYTKITKELEELDGHIRMLNKILNIKIDNFKALKSSILQQELLDEVA
ncbi:restriction endonuclease subunit S [Candidatus Pelagibacter sp.]|nr:restriction endonuclease subunit S [Candidatus Pelagibacter sp.]